MAEELLVRLGVGVRDLDDDRIELQTTLFAVGADIDHARYTAHGCDRFADPIVQLLVIRPERVLIVGFALACADSVG